MHSNTLAHFRQLLPRAQRTYARRVGRYIGYARYPDSRSHFYHVGDFYVAFTVTRARDARNICFRSGPDFDRMLDGIRFSLAAVGLVRSSR